MGCWKDDYTDYHRAIPKLEDPILDGDYKEREDPIDKCADAARRRGFTIFGVQNGGWCGSSLDAISTYTKFGQSDKCAPDGQGGQDSNQVYKIVEIQGKIHELKQ